MTQPEDGIQKVNIHSTHKVVSWEIGYCIGDNGGLYPTLRMFTVDAANPVIGSSIQVVDMVFQHTDAITNLRESITEYLDKDLPMIDVNFRLLEDGDHQRTLFVETTYDGVTYAEFKNFNKDQADSEEFMAALRMELVDRLQGRIAASKAGE